MRPSTATNMSVGRSSRRNCKILDVFCNMADRFQIHFMNSTQSRLIAAAYIAFLTYTVTLSFFKRASIIVAVLLPMSLGTLFNMYVANCTVNGGCKVYAWLIAVLALMSLLSMAASLTLLKQEKKAPP